MNVKIDHYYPKSRKPEVPGTDVFLPVLFLSFIPYRPLERDADRRETAKTCDY